MTFLRLAEYAFAALLFWVLVTQLIMPLWRGRPIFPFFRRSRDLENRLGEVRQAKDEAAIEREIEKEEQKLAKKP